MTNKSQRYGMPAIMMHWAAAVLVVGVGVLGLLHDSWPRSTQAFWINIHSVVGLALWLLMMVRLYWRIRNPPPPLPPESGKLSLRLSHPVHMTLYLLLLLIPVVGIVTFVWHGRVFDFGLFKLDFKVPRNRAIFHPTEDVHGYLAYGLFALAGIHALAAMWHQWVRNDGVLRRMWPR